MPDIMTRYIMTPTMAAITTNIMNKTVEIDMAIRVILYEDGIRGSKSLVIGFVFIQLLSFFCAFSSYSGLSVSWVSSKSNRSHSNWSWFCFRFQNSKNIVAQKAMKMAYMTVASLSTTWIKGSPMWKITDAANGGS